MALSLEDLKTLFAYNAWARDRMLGALAELDEASYKRDLRNSFGSLRDTVLHMLGTEETWLRRWQGEDPQSPICLDALRSPGEVRGHCVDLEARLQGFLVGLVDQDVLRLLRYHDRQGEQHATPLWQTMQHVVNHSTYHRGQVTTMLRQLGASPAPTDLISYYYDREQFGQRSPPMSKRGPLHR